MIIINLYVMRALFQMLQSMRRQFAQLLFDMGFTVSADPKSSDSNQNSGLSCAPCLCALHIRVLYFTFMHFLHTFVLSSHLCASFTCWYSFFPFVCYFFQFCALS